MSDRNAQGGGGVGFVGLLTIVFIALKLTDYIAWSWWWVLSPIWISAAIVVTLLVLFVIGWLVAEHFNGRRNRRGRGGISL